MILGRFVLALKRNIFCENLEIKKKRTKAICVCLLSKKITFLQKIIFN